MATLSRKTLGLMIRLADQYMSHTQIEQLFFELEIQETYISKPNKMKRLQNVVKGLEYRQEEDLLREMVSEVINQLPEQQAEELKDALIKDGFVVGEKGIAEDVPIAEENRSAIEMLIDKHADELDAKTLSHHLKNTLDLFKKEKWDASVGQARNFVEQILDDIAKAIAKETKASPDLSKPVKVREYLQACGFFDESEKKKLVDGVYGYFSEEGSHPGISKQSTARVCMHILWAFAYYILEKFEEWEKQST
ncbi:MAG: hypothetical protein ABSG22_08240 [Sedimentisphaerales bacterium]|jgi:hypothetical protein